MSWKRQLESALGPATLWAALAAIGLGAAAFLSGLGGGGAPRAFGALTASWLFFAGVAVGAAAFSALFRIINAGWARPLAGLAGAPAYFLPVASVVLIAILVGTAISPWASAESGWLRPPLLAGRQLLLNALLFVVAYRVFAKPSDAARPTVRSSVAYLLVFSTVLSVWAFDFVLGPAVDYGNTLIGPYLFVGAFIAGTATLTLLGTQRGVLSAPQRLDAAALHLTLSIFWAYLFWSQYLTIWYGNLPDEIGFALRRNVDGWGVVVLAVVLLVFVVPFALLLNPKTRASPRVLRAVLVGQLLGLWLNCNLLVLPSLSPPGSPGLGIRELLIGLGMLGAFVVSMAPKLKPAPAAV